MKKRTIFLILMLFGLIASGNAQNNNKSANKKHFEHVVVIGIDGLSSEGLKQAVTPVMDNLISNGAVTYSARTVLPTVSLPNWGAMVNGAGPEASGITSNDWKVDGKRMPPVEQNNEGRFPNIFNIVREQMPTAEQGAIYHWDGFGKLVQKEVVNRNDTYKSAEETTQQFCDYIVAKKPVFAFIQLDDVDHAGHSDGHMTAGYLQAVTSADSLVGRIMKSIQQAKMENNTLVMIVSDHGGIDKGHGKESVEEITVPVIFHGKGIKKNYKIQQVVYMYDVAANVAFALNLKAPYAWTGRPTIPVFE